MMTVAASAAASLVPSVLQTRAKQATVSANDLLSNSPNVVLGFVWNSGINGSISTGKKWQV
jgi:hypothetical protein